ncbi:Hypothetical predicted protein [Octopus vulgaris]|uniref:Uncharacterized protein n=1 Tax=Octopus vulgaris TaxID=6645 RepID=A0AA36BNQ8_OCTVU|nr:Hypothetical predicted protein [Octopus vulgaris]
MLGCLMDGSVEDIAECSGGEIGDFEYDAGIGLGVVVAEDGCGGGIGGCSNGCSGGCEDDSDIDSLCIEVVAVRVNNKSPVNTRFLNFGDHKIESKKLKVPILAQFLHPRFFNYFIRKGLMAG